MSKQIIGYSECINIGYSYLEPSSAYGTYDCKLLGTC